jgi:ribokinase
MVVVLHAGANYHIPPEDSDPDLSPYTHLLLQNEIPLDSTLTYLRKAGPQGIQTIFNPSPMLTPEQLRSFPWSDLTWLIVNEGELEDLLHAFGSNTTDGEDVEVRLRAEKGLRDLHGCEGFNKRVNVICTLGAKGILYFQPGQSEEIGHLPAAKLLKELKDTTGAGDCFAGYFVAGLMKGRSEGIDKILSTCLTVSLGSSIRGSHALISCTGLCYVCGGCWSYGKCS